MVDDAHSGGRGVEIILLNEKDLSVRTIPYVGEVNNNCFFSITHDDNNIYISNKNTIMSFDINTYKFNQIISESGKNIEAEIHYSDGYIYRNDDEVNCISKINVKTLEETYIDILTGDIIPELYKLNYRNVHEKLLCNVINIKVDNNKIYLNCIGYINILTKDNKPLLELYKNEMNKVIDNPYEEDYIINNQMKKNIWYSDMGLTRADSFDDIIITKDIFIEKIRPHLYTGKQVEIVFDMETNSALSTKFLLDGINNTIITYMLIINGDRWYLYDGELIKYENNTLIISRYKTLDKSIYDFISMTHDNNNIYIFVCKPFTYSHSMIIFNINTEKIEFKNLNNDIFNTSHIINTDYINQ